MLNGLSFIETGPTTGVETGQEITMQIPVEETSGKLKPEKIHLSKRSLEDLTAW